jgi:hemin uptake protein HemP
MKGDGRCPGGPERAVPPPPPRRPVYRTEDLLGPAGEAVLVHGGEEYRLRITRNGRLILTK